MRRPIALIAKPQTTYAQSVQAASLESRAFAQAERQWPERIMGVYQLRGDPEALIDAIAEDLEAQIA